MTGPDQFELHLCGTYAGADRPGAGDSIAGALVAALAVRPFAARAEVRRFACLGGCRGRGRASIAAAGRWSVAFGGLRPEDAGPLCDFIALWLTRPAGQVPKAERPVPIHDRIIARMPPSASPEGVPMTLRESGP